MDRAEAFAWLKLASESGAGSVELVKLTEVLSPAELTEGRRRLEELREQMRVAVQEQPQATVPVVGEVPAAKPVVSEAQLKLAAEKDQLATQLSSAISELAQLRAAQAKAGGAPEKLRSDLTKAEGELNEARTVARQMAAKNLQLEDVAAERGRALEQARQELSEAKAAAQKAVPAPLAEANVTLTAERDSLQKQLLAAQDGLRKAQAEAERSERIERELVVLRAQHEKLVAEQAKGQESAANVEQLTREVERLKSLLGQQSQDTVATAGNISTLMKENERLKAQLDQQLNTAATASAGQAREIINLKAQLAEQTKAVEHASQASVVVGSEALIQARERVITLEKLNAELSARAASAEAKLSVAGGGNDVEQLRAQLAETDMKLQAALRSYTVQQQENDQGREHAVKSQAELEAKVAALQAENGTLSNRLQDAIAESKSKDSQLADSLKESGSARQSSLAQSQEASALRDQIRQTQLQLAQVVEENGQLKTKLAVIVPGTNSQHGTPTRPGTAAAQAVISLPSTLSTPVVAKPTAPTPAPVVQGPKLHVIKEGDSLTKIARKYYGTADRWNEIFEANRNILSEPGKLPLGASLRIP